VQYKEGISTGSDFNTFIVYLPDQKVKFTKTDQSLYVFKPKINKSLIETPFVNTVNENKDFFTTCQFEKEKQARELCHAL
jgi:hypothetical protein